MSQQHSFSIIGAGVMGKGLALNLKQAGAKVQVYVRDLTRARELIEKGIHASSDPVEASRATRTIVLCLTTDEVLDQVVHKSGLFRDLSNRVQDGESLTLIDAGTTSPEFTESLANDCAINGISFLDAPMTGSKNAAAAGEVLFMAGGSDQTVQSQTFFFETCGKKVIHCGPTGSGQRVKIALNLTQASIMQALTEGWILSRKLGVSTEVYGEVIRNSAARSGISDFKLECIFNKDYEEHFALKNMNKDVNHAMNLARKHNVSLPLASSLKTIYEAGMNRGFEEDDFCGLARVNEFLNGLNS
ncbi:MAG: NAD(P)-dependent oxidoreductase [Leptospiraceae bacterium]